MRILLNVDRSVEFWDDKQNHKKDMELLISYYFDEFHEQIYKFRFNILRFLVRHWDRPATNFRPHCKLQAY
jgi:hypothetical protein